MCSPQENMESLHKWTQDIKSYHIPRYDELPSIELYMDQVVAIIEAYLLIYMRDTKDRRITPAMINNYVKLKILPAPIKKKYSRMHLCYLIIICMLKQVLSISEIRDLVQAQLEHSEISAVYNDFCTMQEQSLVLTLTEVTAISADSDLSFSDMTLRVAVHSNVNKMIAERMIDIRQPPKEHKKKEKD